MLTKYADFNLHVISNHTPYLQTLGFHGRIRVTTNENNDKVGQKCHMLHDQCCPALIENDAVRFENSLHNTHTKIRNETSTSREDWISEFTEPKEQGYWILTQKTDHQRTITNTESNSLSYMTLMNKCDCRHSNHNISYKILKLLSPKGHQAGDFPLDIDDTGPIRYRQHHMGTIIVIYTFKKTTTAV